MDDLCIFIKYVYKCCNIIASVIHTTVVRVSNCTTNIGLYFGTIVIVVPYFVSDIFGYFVDRFFLSILPRKYLKKNFINKNTNYGSNKTIYNSGNGTKRKASIFCTFQYPYHCCIYKWCNYIATFIYILKKK